MILTGFRWDPIIGMTLLGIVHSDTFYLIYIKWYMCYTNRRIMGSKDIQTSYTLVPIFSFMMLSIDGGTFRLERLELYLNWTLLDAASPELRSPAAKHVGF